MMVMNAHVTLFSKWWIKTNMSHVRGAVICVLDRE